MVAEPLPDLTVYRTARRGPGFDTTRLQFVKPETAPDAAAASPGADAAG